MSGAKAYRSYDSIFNATLLLAGFGYVIDIFDFFLYNTTRVASLTEFGLSKSAIVDQGVIVLQLQVVGLLLGGILWGVLGDKIGRKSTLLGSVLIYSIGSLLSGFTQSVETYKWLRFVTGFGLAGEIGIGLVLVTETLKGHKRGWGIALFVLFGFIGMVLAGLVGSLLPWRVCYIVGGCAGLLLLLLRSMLVESGLFEQTKKLTDKRGQFFRLFLEFDLFKRFICSVFILMPNFFAIGLFLTFSPEILKAMGTQEPAKIGLAFVIYSACAALGDLLATFISRVLESRKKALAIFLALDLFTFLVALTLKVPSLTLFYAICGLMGLTNIWVLANMTAAEQFGTNLRATAATSVTNMGRATIILITAFFLFLKTHGFDILTATRIVATTVMIISILCWFGLRETYHLDMDYLENRKRG